MQQEQANKEAYQRVVKTGVRVMVVLVSIYLVVGAVLFLFMFVAFGGCADPEIRSPAPSDASAAQSSMRGL